MEDVVGGMVDVGAGPLGHHLVHQLAPAGDVGDPLEAADLDRGGALQARRRHPVGERPHVLGRQAVGAQQRHFLQLLAVGEVDHRAVGTALQHPVLRARDWRARRPRAGSRTRRRRGRRRCRAGRASCAGPRSPRRASSTRARSRPGRRRAPAAAARRRCRCGRRPRGSASWPGCRRARSATGPDLTYSA